MGRFGKFIIRAMLYSWLYVILIFSRIIDLGFLENYISESYFVYISLFVLALVSLWGVVTNRDEIALFSVVRMRYGKLSIAAAFVIVWFVVLAFWYNDIDGYRDVEESYFYYTPLLFILSFPGSLLLPVIKYMTHMFTDSYQLIAGANAESTLTEFRMYAITVWLNHFLLFLVQVYIVNKWVSTRMGKE